MSEGSSSMALMTAPWFCSRRALHCGESPGLKLMIAGRLHGVVGKLEDGKRE